MDEWSRKRTCLAPSKTPPPPLPLESEAEEEKTLEVMSGARRWELLSPGEDLEISLSGKNTPDGRCRGRGRRLGRRPAVDKKRELSSGVATPRVSFLRPVLRRHTKEPVDFTARLARIGVTTQRDFLRVERNNAL